MPVSTVLLVIGALIVGVFAVFQSVIAAVLWYQLRNFLPIAAVQSRLSSMEMEITSLSGQVTKLRTSKAGLISNARRKEAAQAQDEEDDTPGLNEEEKALFRGIF